MATPTLGFYNDAELDSTFGFYALHYIPTFGNNEFYWISSHKKAFKNIGTMWQSMDETSWFCYLLSTLIISVILILITFNYDSEIDPTNITLRICFGVLEPYQIIWLKGVKSIRILVTIWLLLGISFNMFFNIDYRSALMIQSFPPKINSDENIDLFRDGVFMDYRFENSLCKHLLTILGRALSMIMKQK